MFPSCMRSCRNSSEGIREPRPIRTTGRACQHYRLETVILALLLDPLPRMGREGAEAHPGEDRQKQFHESLLPETKSD
jgi:hypothetical protein